MRKKTYKTKGKYDILNPIDRKDWRESMSQIVYAVVPKEFYSKLLKLKEKGLNWRAEPYIEQGRFGVGAYFFIDNLDYAKHCANKINGFVMETEIEVKNALHLLTSSVGQQQIQALLKDSTVPQMQPNKNIFDILIEKSTKKYDSIMGIDVDTETKIGNCDMVYGYMSMVICIKDYSCIKDYKGILHKPMSKRSSGTTKRVNRPNH